MTSKHYWFRPKQFWRWFAFYYPSSLEGWIVAVAALVYLITVFKKVDSLSHSGSDTLIEFSPHVIAVLVVVDILTRLTGEWPSWWRKK